MAKKEAETIFTSFVLGLQICLALWQVIKLTPVGAVIQGFTGYLLQRVQRGAYYRLRRCPGRVFKRVRCLKMLPTHEASTLEMDDYDTTSEIQISYLEKSFHLERKVKGNRLFVNEKMTHYITDVNWHNLRKLNSDLEQLKHDVFLRNHKQFWDQVTTGGVMSFEEVLDCLIVEHYDFTPLPYHDWLLPVDLSVSEQKLLKVLNLAGLVLQTKKAFGVLPVVLTLTSVVLEFIAPLRNWIYGTINIVFCWAMHNIICYKLSYSRRKQVYSLGNWVDNLRPSNDIEFRPMKGDHIHAVIGGGAKASCSLPYVLREEYVDWLTEQYVDWLSQDPGIECGDHILIKCEYVNDANNEKAKISYFRTEDKEPIGNQSLRCYSGHADFLKICTFICCIAENRCGSLKSYDPDNKDCCGLLKSYDLAGNKVRVRSLMESTVCYVLNQCPSVYVVVLEKVENVASENVDVELAPLALANS